MHWLHDKIGCCRDEYWSHADLEWPPHVPVTIAQGIYVGAALSVDLWKFSGVCITLPEGIPWMIRPEVGVVPKMPTDMVIADRNPGG
jgi:hypothetical protein